jgi:hypothetical protein
MGTSKLDGKVGIVTGAGSGIGRAIVLALCKEGARGVVVGDIDPGAVQDTADMMKEYATIAVPASVDVSDSGSVNACTEAATRQFDRLDLAVNCAGLSGPNQLVGDTSDEAWHRIMQVNLDGVFYCMRSQINAMLKNGGGAIVNIASGAAVDPTLRMCAYNASKVGAVALTRTAAGEYARQGIRVNAVLPGVVRTPMLDGFLATADGVGRVEERSAMGRIGEPDEVAEAVVWLCSPNASYVNGAALLVDGGSHAFRA